MPSSTARSWQTERESARDISDEGPSKRFVQLPTDRERSATTGVEQSVSPWSRLEYSNWERREHSGWVHRDQAQGTREALLQATLIAAFVAWLQRYTGQPTISLDVFGTVASPSARAVLDLSVEGDSRVDEVVESTRRALSGGQEPRAETPASNVALTFLPALLDDAGVSARAPAAALSGSYDVHFVFAHTSNATELSVAYNAKLLDPPSVARLVESYSELLGAAVRDPNLSVERLTLLTPSALNSLTVEQDSGTAPYADTVAHRSFEAFAAQRPGALAVRFQTQRLTYAELDERSNQLAHYLIAHGAGPGVPIAVCLRPSVDAPLAMLAIWKARAIYLPLDPTHPEALIGRMLEEAKPRLVLTTSALAALSARFEQLTLDTSADVLAAQPSTAPTLTPSLEDPAYLFYTSGTTGKSKGVLATQKNLAQYVRSAAAKYGFCESDVFSSLARYTFSISLFELLSPLCCGGTLYILERDEVLTPERLFRALEQVTVLHAGPSLLGALFRYLKSSPDAPMSLPGVRHASSGGDMVQPSIMEEMKRVFPNAELFVIYGCTEVSCMGTTFPIQRDRVVDRTFVGKAFPNVRVRVLDANRCLVPFGVVGEICFAGDGVVREYLGQPQLTAEKFLEIEGERFYQTGDMGRLHADGNLEILGRRDFQVQLRGIRIELPGIEKTVLELGLAAQCAVVAKAVDDGDLRLVAFVVKPTRDGIAQFRQALGRELPDYMLPHHLVVLDAMPLTVNGKLDRNQLKALPWQAPSDEQVDGTPDGTLEEKIANVFAQVLRRRSIGVSDSFFDLGGDSLLGVLALEKISKTLGVTIAPHVLFERQTAVALASEVQGAGASESKPILLNAEVPGTPLFMLSGIHIYRELAKRLEGHCSVYGVFAPREVEVLAPSSGTHNVESLARDYVALIRTQQPKGPYRLLGYSFAGLVAYEVAQQLRAAGDEVIQLVLVDASLPEWILGWRFRVSQLLRLRSARLRDVGAFAMRRLFGKRAPVELEFVRYANDATLGPLEVWRNAANLAAAEDYMPRIRPFFGNVSLFTAGERLREDPLKSPSCGWDGFIPGLHVHALEADHFRMLSDDPYVSELAATLIERMPQR